MCKQFTLVALLFGLLSTQVISQDTSTTTVVEELTFDVPPVLRSKFLKLDHQIWTTFQSQQPGFISKETLITKKSQRTVKLLIRWRNEASRSAVPKESRATTVTRFEQAMGGSENYKLVSVKTYLHHRVFQAQPNPSDAEISVEIDLGDLLSKGLSKAKRVEVAKDPTYRKDKSYLAVSLREFLEDKVDFDEFAEATVVFECSDGYRRTMPMSRVAKGGGWLAIKDLDAPNGKDWTPHFANGRQCQFEPCYLVWPDSNGKSGYAWPYGLVKILIQRGGNTATKTLSKQAAP